MFRPEAVPLPALVTAGAVALFAVTIGVGATLLPGGFAPGPALTGFLLVSPLLVVAGLHLQQTARLQRLGKVAETLGFYLLLCLTSMLATAALAIRSGPYIDPVLIAMDARLVPWFDYVESLEWLASRPAVFAAASHVYGSLTWQPVALIVAAVAWGRPSDLTRMTTCWAIGLALCIMPFAWLPAQSPYVWYGITPADLPGLRNALPFTFFPILEGLRDGSIDTLSLETTTGMVTIPSFHACGAVMLAWLWWPYRAMRWPMVALNAGMAISAIPIGSHYVVDIVAGIGVAAIAIWATRRIAPTAEWPHSPNRLSVTPAWHMANSPR